MCNQGTCALCKNQAPLLRSHAIPKFVADWMKKTSATGYFRNANSPNLRRQDFKTFRMLCFDCEGILSRWEKQFCEQLFVPFQAENRQSFQHDQWLLRFAVSLAWRTVWRTRDYFAKRSPFLVRRVDAAERCWRDYLLGKRSNAGPFEHHMFIFEHLSANNSKVPDSYHTYTLSGVDSTIANTNKGVWAYTKLPGIAFWTGISPQQVPMWENTLIKPKGFIGPPQFVKQPEFADLLMERVNYTSQQMKQMSEKQHEKIHEAFMQNPDRTANSKTFEIICAERYWKERREAERREVEDE